MTVARVTQENVQVLTYPPPADPAARVTQAHVQVLTYVAPPPVLAPTRRAITISFDTFV